MTSDSSSETLSPARSHEGDSSIINRKHPLISSIPSSFSSNLGKRSSPPRPLITAGNASNSVKDIIARLESKTRRKAPSIYSHAETSSLQTSRSGILEESAPKLPQLKFQGDHDVEDYSLTLLKYKQYFTEQPLGRCLDRPGRKDMKKGAGNGQTSVEVGRKEVVSKGSSLASAKQHDSQHDDAYQTSSEPRAMNNDISLSSPMEDIQARLGTTQDNIEAMKDHQARPRDPLETQKYWNHVREVLWISEQEMEEYSLAREKAATLSSPTGPSSLTSRLISLGRNNATSSTSCDQSDGSSSTKSSMRQPLALNLSGGFEDGYRAEQRSCHQELEDLDSFLEGSHAQSA